MQKKHVDARFDTQGRGVAREVSAVAGNRFDFSICTLVTNPEQYDVMVTSFVEAGFHTSSCEYLYIDNSQASRYDAYAGINRFLQVAQGGYIILCHQDVALRFDGRAALETRLRDLAVRDPSWALAGNAGGTCRGSVAVHITDPEGEHRPRVPLPARAVSLDENFIVVRREANLATSADLAGFHFYGTDLCLIAAVRGYNAWVVDFHLYHESRGTRDGEFYRAQRTLIAKYRRAFADRFVRTTCTRFYVSGSATRATLKNVPWLRSIFKRRDRLVASWTGGRDDADR